MLFFITVINCKGRYFSTITVQEPFKPLTGDNVVFTVSQPDNERVHQILMLKARTKARELGIRWVSGLDWNRSPF